MIDAIIYYFSRASEPEASELALPSSCRTSVLNLEPGDLLAPGAGICGDKRQPVVRRA